MNLTRLRSWSTIAACVALLACGDDDSKPEPQQQGRATILNATAAMIAASALADMPGEDFVVARSRVQAQVPAPRQTYARNLMLGAGRGAAVVTDPEVTGGRRLAAAALGATLDPNKEADVGGAQASIDALLSVVQGIVPGATSCSALPSGKAEACAIAFLILEVKRSEGVLAPTQDAGTDAGDAGTDAGLDLNEIKCGPREFAGATEVTGTITASQTWSGKVVVKNSVYVSEPARITIAPGTEIFMGVDSSIYFSYIGAVGLFADGTAAAPIKICGQVGEKGYWNAITIGENTTSDSYLKNVLIAEGGGNTQALELDGDITLDNVQVAESGKDGVLASDFKADSRGLSVRGSAGFPLVLDKVGALARLPRGGTFSGNGTNQISLTFNTIDTDVTVYDLGVPYLQNASLYQNVGNLVFEAGVQWRMKSDTTFSFAYLDASSVQMKGTASAPIKFAPVDDNAKWGGLTFYDKVNSNSVLSYVEFTGGGQGRPALQIEAPIKLDHVSLYKNVTGMYVEKIGLAPGSTLLKISETQGRPLKVETEGVYTIPADSELSGNTINQVELSGATLAKSGTIPNLRVPYYVSSTLYTGVDLKSLTIAAGTEFVLAADVTLNFTYYPNTFTAVGTATAPIKFRGEQALPGYWRGIVISDEALTNSKLDFVEISDAGGGGASGTALKIDAAVAVTNTKISNSSGYCIDSLRSLGIDYSLGNTLTCVGGPVTLH